MTLRRRLRLVIYRVSVTTSTVTDSSHPVGPLSSSRPFLIREGTRTTSNYRGGTTLLRQISDDNYVLVTLGFYSRTFLRPLLYSRGVPYSCLRLFLGDLHLSVSTKRRPEFSVISLNSRLRDTPYYVTKSERHNEKDDPSRLTNPICTARDCGVDRMLESCVWNW